MFGHAAENFDFALTEICFPYLLQKAEANQRVRAQRRSGVAWFPPGGPFVGLTTYLVGGSAGAIAGVGDRIGTRKCTVKGDSLDADEYLAVLHARLATLPYTFTQSAADIPSGRVRHGARCFAARPIKSNSPLSLAPARETGGVGRLWLRSCA